MKKTWKKTDPLKTYQIRNPAIKHAMAVDRELKEALAKKAELENKIASLRVSLTQTCPHPMVYVTVNNTRIYQNGIWQTETVFKCDLCGKFLRKELRNGTSD